MACGMAELQWLSGGEGREGLNEKGLNSMKERNTFEKSWEMLVMKLNYITDRFSCTRRS